VEPGGFGNTYEAMLDFVHPEDRPMVADQYQNVINDAGLLDASCRIITASGGIKFVDLRAEVLTDADGKPTICRGTLHDITERKRAEQERLEFELRLQRMEKAESLGRMAGAIAHHFNNS
jgi:PAS domain-containing protein